MADMVKVKDFAKNFGLDIKDATKIIEDSGLLGSAQVGETVEMAVINTIVNKITLDNQSKISDYLAGGTKKAEKPAEKKEKIQPKAEKPVQKTEKPQPKAEKPQPKAEKPVEAKKPEVKPEIKAEAKKPEIKPEVKVEAKVEAKPEIKAEPKVEKAPEFKKQEQRPEARQDNRQDNRQDRPQQDRNQRNDRFDRNNQQGGQRPQFDKNEKKPFNKDFNRDGGNQFKNDGAKKPFNKDFNRDNQRPQQNNFFKDSEKEDNRPKFTPKPKPQTQPKPENTVVEIKKKTGATRVVDTRVSSVDLSKYDEKLDSFGSYDHYGSSKQKLKKQNNKDSYGSKKEKERSAMEKMKRAAFEKAKNTQLSITVPDEITVGELATRLKVSSSELIKKLSEKNGIVVLTDSDRAGFQIRNYVKNIAVNGIVKHAYIPDIKGKEKRKDKPSKEGFLGVEGVSDDAIIRALADCGCTDDDAPKEKGRLIKKQDLFLDGLSGGTDSADKRRKLTRMLKLPDRISANMLLDVLNQLYTFDEYKALIEKLSK